MKTYSIREVSKRLEVTAQTLRNWEKSGRLTPIKKSENGYRYYSETQLEEELKRRVRRERYTKETREEIIYKLCRGEIKELELPRTLSEEEEKLIESIVKRESCKLVRV